MIKKNLQSGQSIITLLVVMFISIAIITSAVIVVFNSAQAASSFEQGMLAYYAAENGVENALIRMLRDPTYSGETLNLDGFSVEVSVSNGTILSTATGANSIKKIQVETLYNNTVLTILSWKEIN